MSYVLWPFAMVCLAVLGETPRWINEVGKACLKHQLCAIGEGAGHPAAAANARQELAKIFGTKVKAKLQVSTLSDDQTTAEWVQADLQEWTDEILEGVEITKYHKQGNQVYALAVLDRPKAWKRLRHEIKEKDKKMQVYLQGPKSSSLFKLQRLYRKRAVLNSRYELLKGSRIPEQVSFADITRKQKALSQGVLINVSLKEKAPALIRPILIQALTAMGFRVVEKNGPYHIQGEYHSQQQFLNVEGFEKHRFTLNLRAVNSRGEQTGALTFAVETSGRNYTQVYGKALNLVKDYILEHIDQLNINPGIKR